MLAEAVQHHQAGRLQQAEALYRRLLPHDAAQHLLGVLLADSGRTDEAIALIRESIAANPYEAVYHYNLGTVLGGQGRREEAIGCYRAAIAGRAEFVEAIHNLGVALAEQGELDEAVHRLREATMLRPQMASFHFHLGTTLLAAGQLSEGWREFEWRWQTEQMADQQRGFAQPQWRGEPGEGRCLLIHAEQGFGDSLQFCRYAPLAAARGWRVCLEVPGNLVRLLRQLPGVTQVVAAGAALPVFDRHCPMLSLPLAFGTTLPSIPAGAPYLLADPAHAADWAARLQQAGARRPGLLVGIAWAGDPRPCMPAAAAVDRRRSMPTQYLAPLFGLAGLHFVSLQQHRPTNDKLPLIDLMHEVRDFADTAALIANLDLVICVDTAVAHLAAGMGKPVWLLDRFDPCWRWLRGRRDSPWYPGLRIYRQPEPGDWAAVMQAVMRDLRALAAAPQSAEALYFEGIALGRAGQPQAAAAAYRRALAMRPDFAEAHNNLGVILLGLGEREAAVACYRAALAAQPGFAQAHSNLGAAWLQLGAPAAAIAACRAALALKPDYADALYNLACALRRQAPDQLAEPIACYRAALAAREDFAQAHTDLATALAAQGDHEAAIASYRRALAIDPTSAEVHNDLGLALRASGDLAGAIASHRNSIALRPDYAETHINLGQALLASGDFIDGWAEFEWRWKKWRCRFTQPQWRGEAAAGRRLLIRVEGGYGDSLQFCRYAPLAAARGFRVALQVQAPLVRLLRCLDGVEHVFAVGEPPPEFDLHCPSMSLPGVFGTTLETIPAAHSYLRAAAARVAEWRARLDVLAPHGLRIGLVWAGNPATQADPRRSLPPSLLAPLFAVPDRHFFSLQLGAARDSGLPLIDLMDEMADFADTAALVSALDLVIAVDTAVAHLAAALGRPVWLLDRFDACWRWLRGRRTSPWYPTLTIYRQPQPGDWGAVIADVAAALSEESKRLLF